MALASSSFGMPHAVVVAHHAPAMMSLTDMTRIFRLFFDVMEQVELPGKADNRMVVVFKRGYAPEYRVLAAQQVWDAVYAKTTPTKPPGSIYVTGLRSDATRLTLFQMFSGFGAINSVSLTSSGVGFVNFANVKHAIQAALGGDRYPMLKVKLQVNQSRAWSDEYLQGMVQQHQIWAARYVTIYAKHFPSQQAECVLRALGVVSAPKEGVEEPNKQLPLQRAKATLCSVKQALGVAAAARISEQDEHMLEQARATLRSMRL